MTYTCVNTRSATLKVSFKTRRGYWAAVWTVVLQILSVRICGPLLCIRANVGCLLLLPYTGQSVLCHLTSLYHLGVHHFLSSNRAVVGLPKDDAGMSVILELALATATAVSSAA